MYMPAPAASAAARSPARCDAHNCPMAKRAGRGKSPSRLALLFLRFLQGCVLTKTVVHRYTFLINKCTVGRLNMKYTLTGKKIDELAGNKRAEYPKYTSQLINIANQNARGTRADVVGQLSELFEEFRSSGMEITLENWRAWYMKRYPDTIEASVRKIERHVENLRCAMQLIDHDLILRWVDDLVIDKTFAEGHPRLPCRAPRLRIPPCNAR